LETRSSHLPQCSYRLFSFVSPKLIRSCHLMRTRSATANGSELCFTLNYHLSTRNFLSATASGWLQRLVRRFDVSIGISVAQEIRSRVLQRLTTEAQASRGASDSAGERS